MSPWYEKAERWMVGLVIFFGGLWLVAFFLRGIVRMLAEMVHA